MSGKSRRQNIRQRTSEKKSSMEKEREIAEGRTKQIRRPKVELRGHADDMRRDTYA